MNLIEENESELGIKFEAQFKTLKYHATYPKVIYFQDEAKLYLRGWFKWYNNEHRQ